MVDSRYKIDEVGSDSGHMGMHGAGLLVKPRQVVQNEHHFDVARAWDRSHRPCWASTSSFLISW